MNYALVRAAARAYHVSEKAVVAAFHVTPSVDRSWARDQGFDVDRYDPNTEQNRLFLTARALAHADPGLLTTQIRSAAQLLGHVVPRWRVWHARWWHARKWGA